MQTSTEKFSLGKFLGEVRTELKKVHWPTKKDLTSHTITVIVSVLVLAILIYGIDSLVLFILSKIIGS